CPRAGSSSTISCGAWSPTCSRPRRCSSCWASSGLTEAALLLDVERLTFGFDALAHHGRQVVFVPYAAPGERVRAEVVERRAGYLRARVDAVLAAGPDRGLRCCQFLPTAVSEIAASSLPAPSGSSHPEAARAWVAALLDPLRRVTVSAAPAGVALAASATARPGPADLAASEALLARAAGVRGTVVTGAGVRLVAGDPTVRVALEPGLDLEVPADVFTQVNPGANQRLVETVLALGAFTPGERVLDLYCGAGNLSLPLARRGVSVLGIERSGVAVEAARANAARHGLPAATFRADHVARALASLPSGSLDAVVLDPPRAGAADALPALAALRPPRIIYVSCDPATLARDVRTLLAAGYRLERVQPIDVFPQTYHVESVTKLRLT